MNANSATVSERIYTAIRNDILNKTLVSGEKLTIKSILYEEAQNGRLTDAARKIRIQSTIFSNQYEIKEENRREILSKGHHIGHGFGISPSADGNRTAVVSGHFPVSGQQGAQHRAIRRPPGRLFSFSRPGVCVRKPSLLALRAGVRKLRRRPGRLFSFSRPGVCVRKPISLALRAGVRKRHRRPGRLFSFSRPGVCVRKPILLTLRAGVRKLRRRRAGLFAPPCPQILMPSFRGAKTPAAVPNRCRGFSISLFLCYILISSMPAFPHTHRRCTAYP